MSYSIKKMFDPEQYIINNPNLFGLLPENNITDNRPLFFLMSDNEIFNADEGGYINSSQIPEAERQLLVMGFPIVPSQIQFSYASNYGLTSRALGVTEDLQFLSNNAERVSISDIMLSTRSTGRTFLPLIQKLQFLMTNQYKPSFFYIGIQDRILYPMVLNNMNVEETGWHSGLPVEAKLSLEFIRSAWGNNTLNNDNDKRNVAFFTSSLNGSRTIEEAVENKDLEPTVTSVTPDLPILPREGDELTKPLSFISEKHQIVSSTILNTRRSFNELFS